MLMCDKTVTVVKCDGEIYTLTVIVGVSWFTKTEVVTDTAGSGGLKYANTLKVRIPAAVVPDALPEVGDQIILGALPPSATIEKPADLKPYAPRKIMGVGDNMRGGLPHIALTCQ
jgi:hypothetical protein